MGMNELSELYEFNDEPDSERPTPTVPEDRLLAELVDEHKALVWGIKNHDSLLEAQVDENLTEEERKAAWEDYEQEEGVVVDEAALGWTLTQTSTSPPNRVALPTMRCYSPD